MLSDSILRVGGERVLVALCAIILAVEREMLILFFGIEHLNTQLTVSATAIRPHITKH